MTPLWKLGARARAAPLPSRPAFRASETMPPTKLFDCSEHRQLYCQCDYSRLLTKINTTAAFCEVCYPTVLVLYVEQEQ